MGTHATIYVQVDPNTIKYSYLHWDGYPGNAGKTLVGHYNTHEQAVALIELGDMSQLQPSIECPGEHSYDHPEPGCCVFYGRDRGERNTAPKVFRVSSFSGVYEYAMPDTHYSYYWNGECWNYVARDTTCLKMNVTDF